MEPNAPDSGFVAPSFTIETPPPPRRSSRRLLTSIAAVVLLLAGALAFLFTRSGAGGGPDVALALEFNKGDVYKFDSTMSMDGTISVGGHSEDLTTEAHGPIAYRVLRASPGGVGSLVLRVGPMNLAANGHEQYVDAQSIRMRIAKDGRILSGGGLAGGMAQSFGGSAGLPGTQQFTPYLPDHPVSPGDTWDTTIDRSLEAIGSGHLHFVAHNTLLRYETVHGVRTAVIQTKASVPMNYTMDLAKVASRFGATTSPGGSSLSQGSFRYHGVLGMTTTSWLDLQHKQLEKIETDSDMDLSFVMEQVPAGYPDTVGMKGTLRFTLERIV